MYKREKITELVEKLKSLSKKEQLIITDTVESFDNWIIQNL